MGCDYYIYKVLHIYFNENDYLELIVDREKGYFGDMQYDEDNDDYDEKLEEYIKEELKPQFDPIIIYNNNSFNKTSTELKYKNLIQEKINEYCKNWYEIKKIIKLEKRIMRF